MRGYKMNYQFSTECATSKDSFKRCILIVAIYLGTSFIGNLLGQLLSLAIWGDSFVDVTPYMDSIISGVLCILIMLYIYKKSIYAHPSVVIESTGTIVKTIIVGFIIVLFFTSAVFSFAELMKWSEGSAWDTVQDVPFALKFAYLVLLGPIVEELVFRRGLYGSIRSSNNFWFAAIISSVLFGLVHGININTISMFGFGMILCLVYERTGTIAANTIFHMINNFLAITVSTNSNSSTDTGEIPSAIGVVLKLVISIVIFYKLYNTKQKHSSEE